MDSGSLPHPTRHDQGVAERAGLGRVGVFAYQIRFLGAERVAEVAGEIEQLGFGTLWLPGGSRPGIFDDVRSVLDSTDSLQVATAIIPIWRTSAAEIAKAYREIESRYPGRLMVGLGVSHKEVFDETFRTNLDRPVEAMTAFLDELAAVDGPPRERMLLGAQGPRMLDLAAARTAGAHPYNVSVGHTSSARARIRDALLAPQQAVILDDNPRAALDLARHTLALHLSMGNYRRSWERMGFGPEDLADGGSDNLMASLFAMGGIEGVHRRISEHLDAGADHVCVQVVANGVDEFGFDSSPLDMSTLIDSWSQISDVLGLGRAGSTWRS